MFFKNSAFTLILITIYSIISGCVLEHDECDASKYIQEQRVRAMMICPKKGWLKECAKKLDYVLYLENSVAEDAGKIHYEPLVYAWEEAVEKRERTPKLSDCDKMTFQAEAACRVFHKHSKNKFMPQYLIDEKSKECQEKKKESVQFCLKKGEKPFTVRFMEQMLGRKIS